MLIAPAVSIPPFAAPQKTRVGPEVSCPKTQAQPDVSLPEADWSNRTLRKMGRPLSGWVLVCTTLVTWVLTKISRFDLESAGVR